MVLLVRCGAFTGGAGATSPRGIELAAHARWILRRLNVALGVADAVEVVAPFDRRGWRGDGLPTINTFRTAPIGADVRPRVLAIAMMVSMAVAVDKRLRRRA